jgi:hypothetical protein
MIIPQNEKGGQKGENWEGGKNAKLLLKYTTQEYIGR